MSKKELVLRQVRFESLDELVSDAESLLENGYVSNGEWTLGQVCGHCADWMRYPMDGFPKAPWYMRPIFWLVKLFMARGIMRSMLNHEFKVGMPTMPESIPDPEQVSDAEGVKRLKEVVQRLRSHEGELLPSPLFGQMDKETLIRFNLAHTSHHFRFLAPKK